MLICAASLSRIGLCLVSCISLVCLMGCAISMLLVPYGVETGQTLSAEDYARLEKLAHALPGDNVIYRTKEGVPPLRTVPLALYVYTFRSDADLTKLNDIAIGSFMGKSGDAAEAAAALPSRLAKRLTSDGFRVIAGGADTADAYVLSGTVTRADTLGNETDAPTFTQVEATLRRNGKVMGVFQVGGTVAGSSSSSPLTPLGHLLSRAFQGSRAGAVSQRVSELLQRAKSGQREAALGTVGAMQIPAPPGTHYRQAPPS